METGLEAQAQSRFSEELSALRKTMLHSCLECVLNRGLPQKSMEAFLVEDCGLTLSGNRYRLVLLYNRPSGYKLPITDAQEPPSDSHANDWYIVWDETAGALVQRYSGGWTAHWTPATRNTLETLFRRQLFDCTCVFLQAGRDIAAFVNYGAEIDHAALVQRIRNAVSEAERETRIPIAAAVTQEYAAPLELSKMYEECMLIHDYGWSRELPVLLLDDISSSIHPEENRSGESEYSMEKRFLGYVAQQDFYDASGLLDSLNKCLLENHVPLEEVIRITLRRLRNVMEIIHFLPVDEECSELMETLRLLERVRSFPDLRNKTHDFFAEIDDVLDRRKQNKSGKAESILAFIEANFQDANLGAAMICERLRMSPAYLSKVLKTELGIGLVDAVHKVRLREAKHLLEETSLSLDQIAAYVGFTNRWILIRSFKARLGVTPSAYRRALQQRNSREETPLAE